MHRIRRRSVVGALAHAPLWVSAARAADEFSGADRLRALYSAEFRFNQDGVPLVPVAIADGLDVVTIQGGPGLRLLPEGEGGPDVRADEVWQIRARASSPAKLRYWAIVAKGRAADSQWATDVQAAWQARGENVHQFEQGALFAVAGEVMDRRELLVAVGPHKSFEEADAASQRLQQKAPLPARGVYTDLVDRPHGELEAVGLRSGARVRNEGVLWFAPATDAPLRVEGQGREKTAGSYFGKLYVTFDRAGKIAVVNSLPEDRLLAGLLPAEMFGNAPDEALRAQAIAARGQLLTKIGTRHLGDPYRLCARTHCQVYAGAGRETPRATAAVQATRGEVLFTGDGKDLVDTVYSANCGGYTENNENVWPDMTAAPTLRGLSDAVDGEPLRPAPGSSPEALRQFLETPPRTYAGLAHLGAGDRFRWTVTRSSAELRTMLAPVAIGDLRAIEVVDRGVSGRATSVRITGTVRSEVLRGELRIRQLFGGLRSSLFLVAVEGGAATFHGGGFGHGVGLCQTGAVGMAEARKTYRDILAHYYRGSRLRKLW